MTDRCLTTNNNDVDVIILGGGLAGLSLALQLKRKTPEIRILTTEKRQHPVPEVGFKVGESTVELAAHYLSHVLDMAEHLENEQLLKPGLRFYFSNEDNKDIAQRTELGHSFWPTHVSYQLDRGRFENALAETCTSLGMMFLDDCKVGQVELDEDGRHTVTVVRNGTEMSFSSRWVVDASGRAGLLKRQLDLAETVSHNANAVWFRINHNIDIDDWSDDPEWKSRVPADLRRFATNHLLGEGYWVWLIPLASNATSIGIVTDPNYHPHNQLNRFDKALTWLWQHEPQCAAIVKRHQDKLVDFRAMRHYAHGCKRVFSPQRWGITGEAGIFPDPFYSPGSDLIAFSNTLITDLINRDMAGEEITELAEIYNYFYLGQFESVLTTFENQYPLMGHAQAMAAKIIWDSTNYWGISTLLFFNDKFSDFPFLTTVQEPLERLDGLNRQMQAFFRQWANADTSTRVPMFMDQYKIEFLYNLHDNLGVHYEPDDLRRGIEENVRLIETLAVALFEQAAPDLPTKQRADAKEWLPTVDDTHNALPGLERIWMQPIASP